MSNTGESKSSSAFNYFNFPLEYPPPQSPLQPDEEQKITVVQYELPKYLELLKGLNDKARYIYDGYKKMELAMNELYIGIYYKPSAEWSVHAIDVLEQQIETDVVEKDLEDLLEQFDAPQVADPVVHLAEFNLHLQNERTLDNICDLFLNPWIIKTQTSIKQPGDKYTTNTPYQFYVHTLAALVANETPPFSTTRDVKVPADVVREHMPEIEFQPVNEDRFLRINKSGNKAFFTFYRADSYFSIYSIQEKDRRKIIDRIIDRKHSHLAYEQICYMALQFLLYGSTNLESMNIGGQLQEKRLYFTLALSLRKNDDNYTALNDSLKKFVIDPTGAQTRAELEQQYQTAKSLQKAEEAKKEAERAKEMADLEKKMKDLGEEWLREIDQTQKKLQLTEEELDRTTKALKSTGKSFDEAKDKIKTQEQTLETQEKKYSELKQKIEQMKQQRTELNEKVATLKFDAASKQEEQDEKKREEIAKLNEKIKALDNEIIQIRDAATNLLNQNREQLARISGLQAELGQNRQLLAGLKNQKQRLNVRIDVLNSQVQRANEEAVRYANQAQNAQAAADEAYAAEAAAAAVKNKALSDLERLRVLSKQTLTKSEARERKCQEEKERLQYKISALQARLSKPIINDADIVEEKKEAKLQMELAEKERNLATKDTELAAQRTENAKIRAEIARIRTELAAAELAAKDAAKNAETNSGESKEESKGESKGESKEGTKEGTKDKNVDSTLFWVLLGSVLGEDDLKKQKQSST